MQHESQHGARDAAPRGLPSVRVRGIYATALSALLSRQGAEVVEASPVMAERLGLPTDGKAEVRLRDRPDRQGVLLEGPRQAAERLARSLAGLLPDAIPRALRGGEAAWEVELPGGSKRALDAIRAEVLPTLPGHHQLKIIAAETVDRAEASLEAGREGAEQLAAELWGRFVGRALRPGVEVYAAHVKPYGKELRLPGKVVDLQEGRLRLWRSFRPGGVYDSLLAAKLHGDYGEVEQLVGSWVSRRRYLRADAGLIGELYNIQTPTELYPHGVRYLDLEVDVAVWPDGRVEVVDREELDQAMAAGYLRPELVRRALEVAEGVRDQLVRGEAVSLDDWR